MSAFTVSLSAPGVAAAPAGRPVYLESANLITRSLTAADVTSEFAEWFNDAQMLRGLNLNALNFSVDGLRAFVASFDNINNLLLGIFNKADGQLLGFYNFSINPQHRIATITMGASPHVKSANAALRESWFPVCDELFDHRKVDKITARVLANNRRLVFAVMDTQHWVCEGMLKQEILAPDGSRIDVLVLSVFKDLSLRPKF